MPTPILEMIEVNDQGYSLSHGGNHRSAVIGVVAPSCQLGFVLQLLEEDGSWIATHLHLLHPLLVNFLDGGIPEHGLEFADKVVPVWISTLRASGITIVGDPEILPSVGPPVLGAFDEERGGGKLP